eukprot:scaffold3.g6574.t1
MLGDGTCRLALCLFGYAYPAYQCYKALERKKGEGEKWLTYWVIMALFTAVAPLTDAFVFWLPFYYEAKLALPIYLWWNDLAGAGHVYATYLQPLVARHEPTLDARLAEARALAGDWAASGAGRLMELLRTRLLAALLALQSGAAPGGGAPGPHGHGDGLGPSPFLAGEPLRPSNHGGGGGGGGAFFPGGYAPPAAAAAAAEEPGRHSSSFSLDRFFSTRSDSMKAGRGAGVKCD